MALVVADRVRETTTTTGTGTVTLAGAVAGYQSFSAIGNGNTTYYTIAAGTEWEVGIGTYTASGTTLSRDTVLASSNSGSLVNFSAGTKQVFVTYPAGKSVAQGVVTNTGLTMTTDRLLGRATSGTGAIEEIALGANLSITGGVLEAGDGLNSYTLVDQSGNPIVSTTVTITIASPGVVTWNAHGFAADTAIMLSTTGALPTGLSANTVYYIRNPTANTFELSATVGGASINTTGSQSGVHTAIKAASWNWTTNVANVDFTGLAGATEILIYVNEVAVSVSGAAMAQVSVNNGSSFFSTSGNYIAINPAGAFVNTIGATFWGTNSTSPRYGRVVLTNPDVVGAPKFMEAFPSDSTPLRIFQADYFNPINAIRILGSAGGNITSGRIYVLKK